MKGAFTIINSERALNEHIEALRKQWFEHHWLMVQITNEKQRTQLQNNSLHLWFSLVADELNRQGYDVRAVLQLSSRAEIQWTGEAVKEHLWRPVQIQYNGKQSTTRASTKDYPAIYETLNKTLGEKLGVHVPWPSKEATREVA